MEGVIRAGVYPSELGVNDDIPFKNVIVGLDPTTQFPFSTPLLDSRLRGNDGKVMLDFCWRLPASGGIMTT